MNESDNDVVVTGLGLMTALGDDVESCWAAIIRGESGIGPVSVVRTDGLGASIGAEIHHEFTDSAPVGHTNRRIKPTHDRCYEIAVHTAAEALGDSRILEHGTYSPDRVGISIGTLLGGQRLGETFHREWIRDGLKYARGSLLTGYPLTSVTDHLATVFGLQGPRCTQSNACAAGNVAIAYAAELIEGGAADAVLAGGVDPLAYLTFGGFSCLNALDREPCAPYSRSSGLTLGEGAGFLVLERRKAARARGARIVACVAGYGLSADAYHETAPDPSGKNAAKAMSEALKTSGLTTADIDYINGHGTGTPANDSAETKAIRTLFAPDLPPVSSTKSMIGHTMGAAGAVEAVVSVLAIRDGIMPPTVIPDEATPVAGFDIVPHHGRAATLGAVMSTSFAFGGNNAALVLTSPEHSSHRAAPDAAADRQVVITGIGAVAGPARHADDIVSAFDSHQRLGMDARATLDGYGDFSMSQIPSENLKSGINPHYIRKMDDLGRQQAIAVADLLSKRKLSRQDLSATGLFSATTGPVTTIEKFERMLIETGSGDPRVFPNTVMNAAAGHVGLLHNLHGPTATMYGEDAASVGALYFATRMIASGKADRIIVTATDEVSDVLLAGCAWIPGYLAKTELVRFRDRGRLLGQASAAILLEASDVAPPEAELGRILSFGLAGGSCGIARIDEDGRPWARSFSAALREAGCGASDLGLLMSAACGLHAIDDAETKAANLAGIDGVPVFAPKEFVGDVRSSAPLLSLAYGLLTPELSPGTPFLVSAYGVGGSYQSMVARTCGTRHA